MPLLSLHSPAGSLPGQHPRPAQLCRNTISLGLIPQPCTISALPAMPPRPVAPEIKTPTISALPGHYTKAGTVLQELLFAGPQPPALQDLCCAGPCPQGLPLGRYKHSQSPFRWATPARPTQLYTIFTLQACAPKACQAGDPHMHNLHSAGPSPLPPQAFQTGDP
jgi:hypothetical protein